MLKIDEREEGDITILELRGKLLIGDAVELFRQAMGRLVKDGQTRISLDLAGVPYMDSAGLGEITRWYTTLSQKDGNLRLINISKRVRELLTVTGLLRIFEDRAR